MAKIHKFNQKANLAQFQVWIEDTAPDSRYFRLSQFPDILTAGKNAFLINGSPELVPTTNLLIEIVDSVGNTVFVQPIRHYAEGLARLVSVEVYEDTAPGLATITILGHLRQDASGNLPPEQFVNSFNMRWQKRINIVPSVPNSTPIRLYQRPSMSVSEVLIPSRNAVIQPTITASTGSVTGIITTVIPGTSVQQLTSIKASGFTFTRDMVNGKFMTTINGTPFTSSISNILNGYTAQLSSSFISGSAVAFNSNAFNIVYTPAKQYSQTNLTRSFADIRLIGLRTFSGDIQRAKVYAKSLDQTSDFIQIADVSLDVTEITSTQSLSTGDPAVRMGYVKNASDVSQYWTAGKIVDSSRYVETGATASYNMSELMDSVRLACTESVVVGLMPSIVSINTEAGALNPGEIWFGSSSFLYTHPNSIQYSVGSQSLAVTPFEIGSGPPGSVGYVMFVNTDGTRFGSIPFGGNVYRAFVGVQYYNNQWFYTDNITIPFSAAFVPVAEDALIAKFTLDPAVGIGSIEPLTSETNPSKLILSASVVPQYYLGMKAPLPFSPNLEYTLDANILCAKRRGIDARMDVYLVGPAFPSSSLNPLGQKIASYVVSTNASRFSQNISENFIAAATGSAQLRFVIYSGDWYVSNVSIFSANEFGFNPDEVRITTPVENRRFEHLTFRTELFDINNNKVPVVLESSDILFDGGNQIIRGNDNRIDGGITVAGYGGGITLTSQGYTGSTGIPQPSSSAIYIGAGQFKNANTPFIVAQTSGSGTPIFGLGDRLYAEQSASVYTVTVSGTLLVQDTTGAFRDVRDMFGLVSGSGITAAYAIETATNALLSSSANLAFSASILTASITALSSSQAQYVTSLSSSLITNDISISASFSQYIGATSVVDAVNKIKLPTSIKTQDGLYLESSSLGFWNQAQSNYPVVINADGTFRFGDTASFVGGSDPYSNVVGFANGAFLVRTQKLMLQTPNLVLIGVNTASAAANVLKLSSDAGAMTLTSASGFYADGTGNIRAGNPTASFFEFTPSNAFRLVTSKILMDGSGIYMLSHPSSGSVNAIKLGVNASGITSTSGSGVYFDGSGVFRVGKTVGVGDYFLFDVTNGLFVSASNFSLDATISASAHLRLNNHFILMGNSASIVWPPNISNTSFKGFYANREGQFFVGDAAGNYVQFGGQVLAVRAAELVLSTSKIALDSTTSNGSGSLALGTNASAISLNSGTGTWMSGDGTFRVGNPSGTNIKWDGSILTITGSINITGGNAATQTYVNYAPLGGRSPNILVMRKSTSSTGLEATTRLQALGYSVTESLSASQTVAKGYDIVIIDCSAWSIGEYSSLIQDLLTSGSCVWSAGNDTGTDTFFVTSASIVTTVGTAQSSGSAHPVTSNWASLPTDADSGLRIASVQPWAVPIGYYSENSSHIPIVEVSHPGGGVLIHGPRFALASSDADQYLRNVVNYLVDKKHSALGAGLAQTNAQNFATSADTTLSGSVAAVIPTNTVGALIKTSAPSGQGLFLGSSNLGYYSGSAWQAFISSSGLFQFKGNASNFISWDGATFAVNANQFVLTTSTITIDSTVSSGKISLGAASAIHTGQGIWMDGTGSFRVGHPTGSFLEWDRFYLRITGSSGINLLAGGIQMSDDLIMMAGKSIWFAEIIGSSVAPSVTGDYRSIYLIPGITLFSNNYSDITSFGNVYKTALNATIVPGVIISSSAPANPTQFHQGDLWLKI
jgi:hypothetical protein